MHQLYKTLHFEIETFDQIKDNGMRAHHLQHRYILSQIRRLFGILYICKFFAIKLMNMKYNALLVTPTINHLNSTFCNIGKLYFKVILLRKIEK